MPKPVFTQTRDRVDVYDFVEIIVALEPGAAANPFTDIRLEGHFAPEGFHPALVEGFCDSPDGSLFRIRHMPSRAGEHSYTLTLSIGAERHTFTGRFTAMAAGRRGPIRVDPEHPAHFIWEGMREHYFWNGTTTYWLMGWQDDRIIAQIIDRLSALKVNRMRVALNGRTTSGARWGEPLVVNTDSFRFRLDPWVCARPGSVESPGFDTRRFEVGFWQRVEKALLYAREKDMIFDIIFFLDGQDPGVDPFGKAGMGSPDEQLYYQYAAARLSAFSNITWDITNEWRNFRTVDWVNQTGAMLKSFDPYKHVTSCHGHEDFPFAESPWCDFVMYQRWDESGGHDFLVKARHEQMAAGRPLPIVNEEYGYEDHYPQGWGGATAWPTRTAGNRRRLAWEMTMAGCYQTTGERADGGTGRGEDIGGGWINGRGNDSMTMLEGYAHLVSFFTGFPWWRLSPRPGIAPAGVLVLAEAGKRYVAYVPSGQTAFSIELQPGTYLARWYNCRTGQWHNIGTISSPSWACPVAPDAGDWALLIEAL